MHWSKNRKMVLHIICSCYFEIFYSLRSRLRGRTIWKCFKKTLILAFEANSVYFLNCAFFRILAHCDIHTQVGNKMRKFSMILQIIRFYIWQAARSMMRKREKKIRKKNFFFWLLKSDYYSALRAWMNFFFSK